MNKKITNETVICMHEDRLYNLIGLKLAVLSIQTHHPELTIIISCPNPPDELVSWVNNLLNVTIISCPEFGKMGWNVKPSLLLRLLESGYANVIWIDSDIILRDRIITDIAEHNSDTLVVTEEPYWGQLQGGSFRTQAWGLKIGRSLKSTVNTGIVRVTNVHIPLLQAWIKMLNHHVYLSAQKMPALLRPLHMIGDQEVLTALVCSDIFKNIPVVMLKRGGVIAQCFGPAGYTPYERLKNVLLLKTPSLFHVMGPKPWLKENQPPSLFNKDRKFLLNLRDYYEYVSLEVSPYMIVARKYSKQINEDTSWMHSKTFAGKLLNAISLNNPNLIGLPLAIIDSLAKRLRRILGINRFSISSDHVLAESPFDIKK